MEFLAEKTARYFLHYVFYLDHLNLIQISTLHSHICPSQLLFLLLGSLCCNSGNIIMCRFRSFL